MNNSERMFSSGVTKLKKKKEEMKEEMDEYGIPRSVRLGQNKITSEGEQEIQPNPDS